MPLSTGIRGGSVFALRIAQCERCNARKSRTRSGGVAPLSLVGDMGFTVRFRMIFNVLMFALFPKMTSPDGFILRDSRATTRLSLGDPIVGIVEMPHFARESADLAARKRADWSGWGIAPLVPPLRFINASAFYAMMLYTTCPFLADAVSCLAIAIITAPCMWPPFASF